VILIEILSVVRRRERHGLLTAHQAAHAVEWLAEAPIGLSPHRPLVQRAWEIRHSISTFDSTYVTMAETLGVPLVTTDARLARSNGHKAEIEVYRAS
jgi:predicted nucleic acid-binding protein